MQESANGSKIVQILLSIGFLPIVLLVLGFGIGTSTVMPNSAQMYVNHADRQFYAPICDGPKSGFQLATYGDVRGKDYEHIRCSDENIFLQEKRSLSGRFLEGLGVLSPFPSRWNEDGTWNW